MQYPIFQFFYWLVNTPGAGSIFVALAGGGCVLGYFLTLRWIARGRDDHEPSYSYPTPALHYTDEN